MATFLAPAKLSGSIISSPGAVYMKWRIILGMLLYFFFRTAGADSLLGRAVRSPEVGPQVPVPAGFLFFPPRRTPPAEANLHTRVGRLVLPDPPLVFDLFVL